MSAGNDDLLRGVTREVLAELLPGLLEDALAAPPLRSNGNGPRPETPSGLADEDDPVPPQVPAPPIAKVHRPTGWSEPAPAESPPPQTAPDGVAVESVALRSDADVDAFARGLARRCKDPGEREAILAGKVRFQLAPASAASPPAAAPTVRVEAGAVTERAVKEAAQAGARLVLSPRAVLTPMARDRARSLGVQIEKEKPC